ncbi:BadF/BadG/BcrA/BcrD ATPase family protein [Reyranella soli]|jgi:glucosamine kinase|uniref:N-acetylglucosamine kinase n=1 Tax=Reyranella soli TaxID=1230389 RepID=A0A512NPM0_9HYPH|nr:BadF/BadG/BcrA/BcrD ATPase family protein [Reyranella soli]GEP60894.1 N-acetylglucosamine kinase [Reyranella soli]
MNELFLGIDAGGTHCRARLVDADGNVLGSGRGGPANLTWGIDKAHRAIMAASAEAFAEAGLGRAAMRRTHAGMGIAGADDPAQARKMAARRFGFASVTIRGDAETACIGAHEGRDGGVLILGTGSNGLVRRRGKLERVSGDGFLISDLGSGAVVGHAAARQALAAHQRVIAPSPLTRRIMRRFDNDPSKMRAWAMAATPSHWGELAPLVFACSDKADPVARRLVADAVADVTRLLDRMIALGAKRIALTGGLADAYASRLPRRLARILVPAQRDALSGAIDLARKMVGT